MTGAAAAGHAGSIIVNASTPLWYVTRATGLVAMVLLTISMALGLLSSVGYQRPGLPRFVTVGLHRNASLLALAFTAVHVITAVADTYAHIGVLDVFIPFVSSYRPLWLGLGAVASDLLIALVLTSLLRTRMSYPAWRAVHLAAYACWPVALVHGLGTGTDTPVRWVLLLTLACVAVITALVAWRLAAGWPARPAARLAGAVALVAVLIVGGAWLSAGPLRAGWSRRAGTPPALLHHSAGLARPGAASLNGAPGAPGSRP